MGPGERERQVAGPGAAPASRIRRLSPVLGALAISVSAGLLSRSGLPHTARLSIPARGAAVAALAAAAVLAAGRDPAQVLARVVHALGEGLRAVLGTTLFVVMVVPAWAFTSLRRHDPLRPRRGAGPGWATVSNVGPDSARRLGGTPPADGHRRPLVGRIIWAVGCVVILVGANFGVGWAWDQTHLHEDPVALPGQTSRGDVPRDPRNDVPAMAAYPWREQYFQEAAGPTGGYWPFTEYRPNDYRSTYVNLRGWLRKTYEPSGTRASMPVAWMFGGSTTWGEGQRDEYTIASWVARLAERDGVPLLVHNYGERGWTHFQEMILYEQQLESEPTPDFSIFYDGANEITAQSLLQEAVPTHTLAYSYAKRLFGESIATELVQKPQTSDLLGDALDAYREHSALHKVVGALRGTPAGASPAQSDPTTTTEPPPGDGFTGGQEEENGAVYNYDIDEQDGEDAGRVYERGKAFTLMLSQRHQVQPFLFWQPMAANGPPSVRARAQLTPPTIDIADLLRDHLEVFIDGGHTNEEGARLVAVEIWKHLEPSVRAWYRENP